MPDVDPIDVLRSLAEREAAAIPPDDATRNRIVAELESRVQERPHRRPSRRSRVIIVASVVVAVASGTAAAAWFARSENPEVGAVCRASASRGADGFVLAPGADPLAGCAELWASGVLPDIDEPRGSGQPVPPMTACRRPGGAVEVLPADGVVCTELGLEPMDAPGPPDNGLALMLQERVANEINASECAPTEVVEGLVQEILNDLELDQWTVVVQPGAEDAECAKVSVDSSSLLVAIASFTVPP